MRRGVRKKWGGERTKVKLNNATFLDKDSLEEIKKQVEKMRVITISTLSTRFKITGSVVRKLIRYLHEEKLIKPFGYQSRCCPIFTGSKV